VAEGREQSEFNMAVSYLNRLNALFYAADESAMSLDMFTWFHSLLGLFRELSTEMKPAEIDGFKLRAKKIQTEIAIELSEKSKGRANTSNELYELLQDFEIDLRKVMRQSGLQLKMQENARNAMR
jgi:hypothetical protein